MGAAKTPSISNLKNKLNKQSGIVTEIGASIRSIEKDLGKNNDKYVDRLSELSKIESQVSLLKMNLTQSANVISDSYGMTKKILSRYLLSSIDDLEEEQLIKKKIYLKLLSAKAVELKKAQQSSKNLLETIKSYEDRLRDTRLAGNNLYSIIVNLENEKNGLSKKYISTMEQKNVTEEKLELAVAKRKVYKKRLARKKSVKKKNNRKSKNKLSKFPINLILPIHNYSSYKSSKKGVTFKYSKVSPVIAGSNGTIVYSGELASYGKVIIIDHGSEVRSVILGDINIRVKKGDSVAKAEVIGYTNADPGVSKSLYFEIRRSNIAQNTFNILKTNNTLKTKKI